MLEIFSIKPKRTSIDLTKIKEIKCDIDVDYVLFLHD